MQRIVTIATLIGWTPFLAPILGLIAPLGLAPLLAVSTASAVWTHLDALIIRR